MNNYVIKFMTKCIFNNRNFFLTPVFKLMRVYLFVNIMWLNNRMIIII